MKVRFLSTKFYVSEKRRTVTCVMTAKLDDRKSGQNNFRFTWEGEERFLEPFEVITVARCHKDDKFDETKGRRIAESKAKRLVYSEGIQRGRMILKAENAYRKELETFVKNTVKYKEKEVAHTSIVMG